MRYDSEASTSGQGDADVESNFRALVTIVQQGNPTVLMGQPKETIFRIDYIEPNKITERDLAKYHAEYRIPESFKWRITGPTESLSNPKDDKLAFFMDILKHGLWSLLQPPMQRIFA